MDAAKNSCETEPSLSSWADASFERHPVVFKTTVATTVRVWWTPHPVIVTIGYNRDYIRVLLYSYYATITGWGVLLSNNDNENS